MALKQRVTAGESDPDPVSVRRILVRDHGERDHLPVAIASVLASETAVETAIVIEIVNVTVQDAPAHATKRRSQPLKPRRTTPNATITMIATGHRIATANVNAIVNAARNIVRDIRLHIILFQIIILAFNSRNRALSIFLC